MLNFLRNLDRRWIFLLMAVAILVPMLAQFRAPERVGPLTQRVFDKIESLPPESPILFAFDYDPGSEPELGPMATALLWHAARKGHKLYCLALWPVGAEMCDDTIEAVLKVDFSDPLKKDAAGAPYPLYEYGRNFINLGYKSGGEGVIKVIRTNLREQYSTDATGQSLSSFPMTAGLNDMARMSLIVSISAGTAGTKEWVQYLATPERIPIVAGVTGVQAPQFYPYYPSQLVGLLGAIKGAAEYEKAVGEKYPEFKEKDGKPRAAFATGSKRMGPQLFGHLLILLLIVLGNIIYALDPARRGNR